MEPTYSVHGDFLYIFSLLSTFFVRRQSMDLLHHPPPQTYSSPESSYLNAKGEEVLKFPLVYNIQLCYIESLYRALFTALSTW